MKFKQLVELQSVDENNKDLRDLNIVKIVTGVDISKLNLLKRNDRKQIKQLQDQANVMVSRVLEGIQKPMKMARFDYKGRKLRLPKSFEAWKYISIEQSLEKGVYEGGARICAAGMHNQINKTEEPPTEIELDKLEEEFLECDAVQVYWLTAFFLNKLKESKKLQ